MNDFSKLLKLFSEIEPTGSPAVLTEGRDSWDSNMPSWQAREQGAEDQSRRDFKRGEAAYDMDAEKWFKVKDDGKMYQATIFPNKRDAAIAQGFSPTREEAQAKAAPEQPVTEGKVKELDQDLTDMSDEDFKAEYNMTKAQAKAGAKDDAPVAESAEVVDEVAAPGQEDWIKSNKERFIKQYGKDKGESVLYATAWKRHHADKANESLEECWDQAMSEPAAEQDSGMTINSSLDTKTGSKNLTVSARGHAAEQLAQILKLAGMESSSPEPMEVEVEMDEEYANEPAPEVQSTDVINAQGNDLNRQKTQHKHGYRNGDNPMAMAESAAIAAIEKRLMEELDSIKTVNESKFTDAVYDYAMDAAQNRVNGWPRRMKSPGQTAYMLGVTDAKFSKAVEQMKVKLIAQLQAKADSGKTNEGWEDMMKDVAKTTKDTTTTGKFDKKKVSTGTVYTKKHGPADNASPVANKTKKTKKTTKTDHVDEDWNSNVTKHSSNQGADRDDGTGDVVNEISDHLADKVYNARVSNYQRATGNTAAATAGRTAGDRADDIKMFKGQQSTAASNLNKNANANMSRTLKKMNATQQGKTKYGQNAPDAPEYDALDAKHDKFRDHQPIKSTMEALKGKQD